MLDRCVFGGQTKGIPAHRLQYVSAQHALVAGDHITDGVVTHVAHVQAATRVREHRQAVEFFFAGVGNGFEHLVLVPLALNGRFDVFWLIAFLHSDVSSAAPSRRGRCDIFYRKFPVPECT